MKPGNLRQQGAKSGEGNRQMRGRMLPHCFRQRVFLLLEKCDQNSMDSSDQRPPGASE